MRKALTDKALDALKPQLKRYEVHDSYCPGLSVRVTPEGRKTFNVKYRYGINQKRMSIGVYPPLALTSGRAIPSTQLTGTIHGLPFVGWSRYRPNQPWNPDSDNVISQLALVEACLAKEAGE